MRIVLDHQRVIKKEKDTLKQRWLRSRRFVTGISFVLIAVISLTLFVRKLSRIHWFGLRHIEVLGELHQTTREELSEWSKITPGINLFSVSLDKLLARMLEHPWVREATVRRQPPDTLSISVVEYTPRALALIDRLYFISGDGTVFKSLEHETTRDFPVFTGLTKNDPKTVAQMLKLLTILEASSLEKNFGVAEIHVNPNLGFSVTTLKHPMEILLGQDSFENKLARLEVILQTPDIVAKQIERIDLNYADKAYVRNKT